MMRATDDAPPTPSRRKENWELVGLVALVLILGLAAWFRFSGIRWDADTHIHPDERFLTETTSLLQTTTNPLTYLRSSESPLSPYNVNKTFYVYGNFPMTVVRYLAEGVANWCEGSADGCAYLYTDYTGIHIVGRALSATLDLISVLFIFLVGARLYNWRVGLLAALLMALAVMPIQQSHFYTMDNWAAGLTTVTMYAAVRASEDGRKLRWWAIFGLTLGLTMASRINVAPLGLMAGVAGLIWLARRVKSWQELWTPAGFQLLQRVIVGGVLAALVTILTFRLAQPYAFADSALYREAYIQEFGREPGPLRELIGGLIGFNPQFLSNMDEIQRLQSPEASFPPALQWTDRDAIIFPLVNMVLYGMGITAAIAAWIGFFWALSRILKQKPDWLAHLLPVAWVGLYFLFMGTRWVKSIRYFLPIYPFLFLLAGWAIWMVWQWAGARMSRRLLATATTLVVVVPSFVWALAFVQIYHEPITRVAASDWMLEYVDSGATLFYELDGEARQVQLPIRKATLEVGLTPLFVDFALPEGGTITGIRFNYLSDSGINQENKTLELNFASGDINNRQLVTFNLTEERQDVTFAVTPFALAPGQPVQFQARLIEGTGVLVDTSVIAVEHWDDAMPVRYKGIDPYGRYYYGLAEGQIPVTIPDDLVKQANMLRWLDEMDYMVISSSKFIWSLPRLPLTFPMMNRFYDALFSGELGFELVGEFHADIHAGPLYISDTTGQLGWGEMPEVGWPAPGALAAEEAFSVYDHPPVWIFRKTDAYTPAVGQEILGNIDLSQQITMNPQQATEAPNGLLLTEAQFAEQRAGGTFRDLFAVDGLFTQLPGLGAVIWWLFVILLGWLAFPLCFVLFRSLPSKGYLLGRV
ncbi:MAG: glycosyltransferase family 39 protein, partial [Anaerolineales bacterium]|nr:glycosyltransferase family 39 protein [Anaerolineales bacterium]